MIYITERELLLVDDSLQYFEMPKNSEILKAGYLNLNEGTNIVSAPIYIRVDNCNPSTQRIISVVKTGKGIAKDKNGIYIDSLTYNNETYHIFDCGEE